MSINKITPQQQQQHRYLRIAFGIFAALSIITAWLKMQHLAGSDYPLLLTLLSGLVFGLLTLKHIYNNKQMPRNEKLMWTLGLIFLTLITGFIYVRRLK